MTRLLRTSLSLVLLTAVATLGSSATPATAQANTLHTVVITATITGELVASPSTVTGGSSDTWQLDNLSGERISFTYDNVAYVLDDGELGLVFAIPEDTTRVEVEGSSDSGGPEITLTITGTA